jgi:hypothetical protein
VPNPVLRRVVLCAGLLLAPGCYSYVPTDMSLVPPGENLRLLVTREGSEEVARIMDSNELRPTVRGQFMGREGQSLLLQIPVSRDPEGIRQNINQVVRIPEGEVLTVDRRQLDRGKSALLVGGSVAVGAFLFNQIFDVFGSGGREGVDPDLYIGMFRIPIG